MRSNGWRTRPVDHGSECWSNLATELSERLKNDTIDLLVWMFMILLKAAFGVSFWKRDYSRAFRRIPLWVGHLDLTWAL